MSKKIIGRNSIGLPFSPAVAADNLVFVSGQMAFGSEGKLIDGGIKEQVNQTLKNIKSILEQAGLGLDSIVKNTVWLTNVEDFSAFNQAYAEFFPNNPPARATVRSDLMVPGALVEIEALAVSG